jgi:hypothetical protein
MGGKRVASLRNAAPQPAPRGGERKPQRAWGLPYLLVSLDKLERAKGFEPSTPTLGRSSSDRKPKFNQAA